MLMSNLHIDLVVAFWGGIPVVLAIARTRPGEIFSTSTQTVVLLFYTAQRRSMSANTFYNQFINWCSQVRPLSECNPHGLRKAQARRLAVQCTRSSPSQGMGVWPK